MVVVLAPTLVAGVMEVGMVVGAVVAVVEGLMVVFVGWWSVGWMDGLASE